MWQAEITGRENLETAHKHLEHGSVIATFNHPFKGDVLWTLTTCLQAFQGNIQHFLAPVAMGQIDFRRAIRDFGSGEQRTKTQALDVIRNCFAFRAGAWLVGAESIPVIQLFDKDIYGQEKAGASWKRLLRHGSEMLSRTGTLLVISPEGDRPRDGKLQQAGRGFVTLWERGGPNCLCLPLGVTLCSPDQGLNIRGEVSIQVGRPVQLQDMASDWPDRTINTKEKREIANKFMTNHLAPLLPPKLQGIYRS